MTPNNILVYGTLRPGCGAYEMFGLDESTVHVATVRIPGTMYDLGRFPGIKLDGNPDGFVCDVLEVLDPDVISRLDRYEGYHEEYPNGSLYIRREITIDGFDDPVYIYEYNDHIGGRKLKEGGDWKR